MNLLRVSVGEYAQPVAAAFGDDHLAAGGDVLDLLRAAVRGDVEPSGAQGGGARACKRFDDLVFLWFLGGEIGALEHGHQSKKEREEPG